jgi:uncharacterized membrane protein
VRSRARAVPAWAWVAAIVVLSTAVRFGFARHMVGPWIMIDEIVYSELAKSFAAGGSFAVRDVPTGGYGVVYPVLISPAYALFHSIPTVYSAIKLINALLMSLAAVPAYLLARRVVSSRGALVVAVLTVAVPSTFYAGTVMTENAFYPIFMLLALALVTLLERPRVTTVLFFLAALALAYETRAQAVAVLAAALLAPFLMTALARRPRELLTHSLLYASVGGVTVLVVLAEVARGRSIKSLLGAYAAATSSSYDAGAVARWLLWHVSELELYVGFVPVFALILLWVQGRTLPRADRAVVAATTSLVALLAVEVAAFASQPSVQRIEERNLFYVAPLLFTCLVLWLERGMPRPRLATVLAAVGVVALAAAVPYERFLDTSATSDTFAVLALWSTALWLHLPAQDIRWLVAGAAAVLVTVAALGPLRARWALPALVLLLYLGAIQPVDSRTQRASIGAVFQGITRSDRDWITAAVGSSDPRRVAVLWTGTTDRLTVNENEFFNRDVGPVYTTNGAVPGGLAQTPVVVSRTSGDYLASGRPVQVRDLLADTSVSVAGREIDQDAKKGLVLLRVDGPLRAEYITTGIDHPDLWAGHTAIYRRFSCDGGHLAVELGSDARLFKSAQLVEAYVGGRFAASTLVGRYRAQTMVVPLERGPHGACTVRFRISRTRVPAQVEPSSTDTRSLGIRFLEFTVS